MSKEISIYALLEPGGSLEWPATVRYIGQSEKPSRRLKEHLKEGKFVNERKGRWTQALLRKSTEPDIAIIEACSADNANERERYWIGYFNALAANLFNVVNGRHRVKIPLREKAPAVRREHATKGWPIFAMCEVLHHQGDIPYPHPLFIIHILNGSAYPAAGGPIRGRDYLLPGELSGGA